MIANLNRPRSRVRLGVPNRGGMAAVRTIFTCVVLLLACACSSTSSCKSPHDCGATERCVNFVCKASGASPGAVGDSCANTGECNNGLSCSPATSGFPNGFCTESCDTATCSSGACAELSAGATCAPTCATDNDCRSGYGCCAALGNVCLPPAACIAPTCKRNVAVSSAADAQVVLHAQHSVGDMVTFTVPPGTASVSIVQQATVANLTVTYKGQVIDNAAVPAVVFKPDNSRAYDDNDPAFGSTASPDGGSDPSGLYTLYGGDTPTIGAFTFPNTAASLDAGVPPGSWRFQVNDYAYECAQGIGCSDGGATTNTYDVTVLAKGANAGAPTLDLAFYIIADMTTNRGLPLNETNAPNDLSVRRMIDSFKTFYSAGGINIGTVTFHDVSGADRARFGTHINADSTGPCDELDQMFTLSSQHSENTLNLFLVQSITSKNQGGGSVVGIDGTIPGPASFAGTVHSGAAVSIADLFANAGNCFGAPDLSCGADEVAFIAAHEAGHFLGLFHTTEQDGRDFDPLTDTGKCPCLSCASSTDLPNCSTGGTADKPIFLKAVQCSGGNASCAGGQNLMFWQLQAPISQGKITAQQAAVMALNPVVH
jgi:hypothetical protein